MLQRSAQLAAQLTATLVAFSTAALTGCQPSRLSTHGSQRSIAAAYAMGELTSDVPPDITVLMVHAAAESTLRARGYIIRRSTATKDRAIVQATSRVDGSAEPTTINIALALAQRSTHITIRSGGGGLGSSGGWGGDEPISRAILDEMLARLGR